MSDLVIPLIAVLFVVALVAGLVIGTRRRPSAPPRRRAREAPVTRPQTPPVVTEPPREQATAPVELARPSLRDRLGKSRRFFGDRLAEALGGGVDEDTWDDIEAVLIQADIGVETATRITEDLRAEARRGRMGDAAEIRALLADRLVSLFDETHDRALAFSPEPPTVWLLVGVNGTGKTTTIGKLTADLAQRGRTVALAAGDTFRAAADEQLGIWAERSGATLIKHQPGADPGAVAFDAYAHAKARGIDVLLVDTAGRLHTKTPLMEELGKIRRVIERQGRVHEALLVIDATAGQNGLVQAKEFADSVGVTGVALTKLDGTAKGGIALAIETTLGIPIKVIGVGEGIDDLEPFEPKTFVDALLS